MKNKNLFAYVALFVSLLGVNYSINSSSLEKRLDKLDKKYLSDSTVPKNDFILLGDKMGVLCEADSPSLLDNGNFLYGGQEFEPKVSSYFPMFATPEKDTFYCVEGILYKLISPSEKDTK